MLRMGTIFGRYRIEGLRAPDGMGVVYRATDTETGQPAALKVVSSIRTLDEENRERLLREAQLVARIDHPGVVPVYEAGEHDGHFYLAMLWVDGSDLEQLLSDLGPLPIERAVEVIANVADALDAAHERGFVHRDVKPANVLVADSGQVYLSDFGLTKVLDASTGLTHTGQLLGTVDYVAPEQIEGRPVDGRADVYSLGGLAYRAITGSVPFDRPGGVARLWAHLNVPAPSLRAKRPDAPRALDAAIRKALAKSPEERFATAGAFAIAAREALGEMAPAAVESGGIEEKVPVLAGAAGPMWEWEPPTADGGDLRAQRPHRVPAVRPRPRADGARPRLRDGRGDRPRRCRAQRQRREGPGGRGGRRQGDPAAVRHVRGLVGLAARRRRAVHPPGEAVRRQRLERRRDRDRAPRRRRPSRSPPR